VSTTSTPTTPLPTRPEPRAETGRAPEAFRRGRTAIVVTLVISLVLSAVLQQVAYSYRSAAINRDRPAGTAAPSRIANLDSFSLALLLGGLRGPLVMFLWTNSESQKNDRDLESFDTQVELIRLLQPEFDTVHLFQIWNKAYNVSAQLAALSNKYTTILDAVGYGERADKSNPNDINLVTAIAGLYTDKLGNSQEKDYYRRRVRSETMPLYKVTFAAARTDEFKKAIAAAGLDESRVRITTDPGGRSTVYLESAGSGPVRAAFTGPDVTYTAVPRQSVHPAPRSGRKYEMDTLLDDKGNLLAGPLLELRYLEKFQPFTYGVSPLALGYNYAKQAQILQRDFHQKHLQLADAVVDNQPAMSLKAWTEEEWDRGRRLEQRGLPKPAGVTDQTPRESRTAHIPADAKIDDPRAIEEAIFSYNRASTVAEEGVAEFTQHIDRYPARLQNYFLHRDNLTSISHLTRADAFYLRAMIDPAGRKALLEQAKAEYEQAAKWYFLMILKYYVEPPDTQALKFSVADVENRSLPELRDLFGKLEAKYKAEYPKPEMYPHAEDWREYQEVLARVNDRLGLIK